MAILEEISAAQKALAPGAVLLLLASAGLFMRYHRLDLTVAAVVLALVVVLLWWVKARLGNDLYDQAMQLAQDGEPLQALGLLLRVEEVWELNNVHGTPKNFIKDFERLAALVAAMSEQTRRLGVEVESGPLAQAIGSYLEVYSNRKSRVLGTHTLRAGAKREIERLDGIFPWLRIRFREACREAWDRQTATVARAS